MALTPSYREGVIRGNRFDPQLAVAFGEVHRARAGRGGQRRLERSHIEIDAVRRQLRDPMRHDCACEIDPLAAGATERYVCQAHALSFPKRKGGPLEAVSGESAAHESFMGSFGTGIASRLWHELDVASV